MSEAPPILVKYTGDSFVPANAPMQKRCDQFFVVEEIYRIEFREERSSKSHKHFMASVSAGWKNLRAEDADRFPTPDHMRKWALVRAGFADERSIVYDTPQDAERSAVLARSLDGFAIIVPRGNVLKIYTAKSQSMRAMDRATFQASKTAVLNIVADMIGTDPATLAANAQDDAPEHTPNPIPASDRNVERTDNESPSPEALTGSAGEAPPPTSPGGSTLAAPPRTEHPSGEPEQTERSGGEPSIPIPKNFTEYRSYLKIWLSFVKNPARMTARFEREKTMWATFNPPLTEGQIATLTNMALDARAAL